MDKKIISVFLVLCLFSFTNAIEIMLDEDCLNYTVYPLQYEINIFPYIDAEDSYYDCELSITIIAITPNVNTIKLDAKDMEINLIRVLDGSRDIIDESKPYEYNSVHGKLYINLIQPLGMYSENNKQMYTINVTFRKKVTEVGTGIFLVKYYDEQAKDYKYLFTTRLSPYKAKYFFPCFDNPRFEAVYKFRVYILQNSKDIQHTNTSLCIAEEQQRISSLKDDYLVLSYAPSPQVGPHQVGFHYSRFASLEAKSKNKLDDLILWAPIDEIDDFKYIHNIGINIINLIHEYAKANTSIVKGPINLIAVPTIITGYEIGSWNLLTNGAHRMVKIDQFTSIKQIETMTFELAQQLSRIWLGNPSEELRTRWKEEWFKEGMATYLAYYLLTQYNHGIPLSKAHPIRAYGLQMKHKAMAMDYHHTTPALETFQKTLAIEIPFRYRLLVQMKTGAILWMLENWIEFENFHRSVVNYVKSMRGKYISLHSFTSALDHDNIECMHQFFNGSTATRILDSWFRTPGYPVIDVLVLRDRTPNAVHLKQRKFSYTHQNRHPTDYMIPISYIVQKNKNCYNCHRPKFTMEAQSYTFRENLNEGWILLNRNVSGYYRVNYDTDTWKLIADTLKNNVLFIDELNRAQIVNDVLVLFVAGDIDVQLAMHILDYLEQERSPVVWEAVLNGFEQFIINDAGCNMTKHLYWEWQEFLTKKVSLIFEQLVRSKDQLSLTRLFRSNIIDLACSLNYAPCHAHVRRMYIEERRGKHNFFPDCRIPYFSIVANETFSNTYSRKYNAIEQDDKLIADHVTREKNKFFMKIPIGDRKPMSIVMSTSKPDITVTEKFQSSKGSTLNSSLIIILILVAFYQLSS